MCYHITVTLPKKTNLEAIRQVINKCDMAFEPVNNNHVISQLRPGELYFSATKGHCDCDTVLGSLSTSQRYEALLHSKKFKKLKKKGWSKEEINNWIAEKMKTMKKKVGRKYSTVEQNKKVTRWITFLRELLHTGFISHIGLLKHWYKGALDSEQISIKKTQRVNVERNIEELLLHLEEDILYEFFNPNSSKH